MCSEPTLRIKGVMFSLRQLKVVAVLGTWDPCLSAGIGMEPAAPLRARCCFIYLKAQVTFLEERRRETCLRGLSALPLFSSVTHLPVKDEIESHQPGPSSDCQRSRPHMNLYVLFNYETVWFLNFQLWVWMFPLKIGPFDSTGEGIFPGRCSYFFHVASIWRLNVMYDSSQDRLLTQPVSTLE